MRSRPRGRAGDLAFSRRHRSDPALWIRDLCHRRGSIAVPLAMDRFHTFACPDLGSVRRIHPLALPSRSGGALAGYPRPRQTLRRRFHTASHVPLPLQLIAGSARAYSSGSLASANKWNSLRVMAEEIRTASKSVRSSRSPPIARPGQRTVTLRSHNCSGHRFARASDRFLRAVPDLPQLSLRRYLPK